MTQSNIFPDKISKEATENEEGNGPDKRFTLSFNVFVETLLDGYLSRAPEILFVDRSRNGTAEPRNRGGIDPVR